MLRFGTGFLVLERRTVRPNSAWLLNGAKSSSEDWLGTQAGRGFSICSFSRPRCFFFCCCCCFCFFLPRGVNRRVYWIVGSNLADRRVGQGKLRACGTGCQVLGVLGVLGAAGEAWTGGEEIMVARDKMA
jgi:hypothetical protein